MKQYLYLSLDLGSILVPLLFSFHRRKHFASTWKAWVPALIFPAILFIIWDGWFSAMRVWGFNPSYLTGLNIGNLPLEEVIFFLCIPYACLFTYVAVNHLKAEDPLPDQGRRVTWVLIVGLTVIGLKYYDRWYTAVTFFSLALFLLLINIYLKPAYMGRFYFSFLFILIPFFLVNGVLTGSSLDQPIVWYNDAENLGIRLATIPIEDVFYGMLLILMNVVIYEYRLRQQQSSVTKPAAP